MEFGHYADKEPLSMEEYPFRCPSWDPLPSGKKNVVILGCSHTWGVGLESQETWAHKVSQHNTERLRYWNLGQPGLSPEGLVRILYRTEKTLFPKILIICWPESSRREWFEDNSIVNLSGSNKKLEHDTAETDLQIFLKSLFFVEKFAEKVGAKTFHCFASSYIDIKHHDARLNVLEDYTLSNCWPHWNKFAARELHTEPSLARDGKHYGEDHHERFANLFLEKFGSKLK